MKFGLIFDLANPVPWRRPGPDLYAEVLDAAEEIEALGFDSIWLTEHHFASDWNAPSALVVAAAIAARTSRIRIGTWALLLPMHDPLRIAEDTLVVDQFAEGRFELGVSAGYRVEEFVGFGIDRKTRPARMEEGVAVLAKALAGERFSFAGEFYKYTDVQATPLPSHGGVKLWSGGHTKASARRAARYRTQFLPSGPFVEPLWNIYANELVVAGEDPASYDAVGFQPWYVSKSPAETLEKLLPHLDYRNNTYAEWYAKAGDSVTSQDFADQALVAQEEKAGGGVVGSPEEILASIREFVQRAPYTEVISWATPIGVSWADARASARLFAEEVMPEARKIERKSTSPASAEVA